VNKKSACNVANRAVVASEVRGRPVRVTTALQSVIQNHGAFANPGGVYLEVVLAIHELEAARALISSNWILSEHTGERQ
jgi:hypothetical protein